tara:strand:+ start:105 stop:410 length:306 start_codon:yes stop_codon:yes gene_type:complete
MIEQAMLIALKATLIFQATLIFYFFGKDEKIPYSARDIFFILANGGCLFLAGGLIFENSFLIKGGIFILIVQALIDAHSIISKYLRNKSIEKEEEKSNAKK